MGLSSFSNFVVGHEDPFDWQVPDSFYFARYFGCSSNIVLCCSGSIYMFN